MMRTFRGFSPKLLLVLPLLIAVLMWGEHERRGRMLIGTWQVFQADLDESRMSAHLYYVFNRDGTGEYVLEDDGDGEQSRSHAPFTYTFSGFSRLEITCDWTFYGNGVVKLDDPLLAYQPPNDRIQLFFVNMGLDQNSMYINPGDLKHSKLSWHRVTLKPLPGED